MKTVIIDFIKIILMIFFLASSSHALTVTFAWDAESGAVGYKIYYGDASRNYTNVVDVGNVTTYPITFIEDGTIVYVAATAYDSARLESDFSNELFFAKFAKASVEVDVEYYSLVIDSGAPITSTPQAVTGGMRLHHDVANLIDGPHTIIVNTCNIWKCVPSPVFTFKKAAPKVSTSIKIEK